MNAEPLPAEQLAAIEAREAAATPGPWEHYPQCGPTFYGYLRGEYLRGVGDINFGSGSEAEADLAFVLSAREDVPALLAEVRRLRGAMAPERIVYRAEMVVKTMVALNAGPAEIVRALADSELLRTAERPGQILGGAE